VRYAAAITTHTASIVLGGRFVTWIFVLGAFVFALSGGLAGARKHYDFFGVIVMSGVVGLTGGALRDTFLGVPAVAIFDWRLVLAVVAAGTVAFFAHGPLLRLHYPIQVLDGIGLSLFSVIGAEIALQHHASALAAAALGTVTGIGGGIVRDVLLNELPQVFHSGLYAIPSLLASGIVVAVAQTHHLNVAWCLGAATVCLVVRLIGIFYDVNLPRAA